MCLALNYIVKFISHRPFFKDVYREAGILCLITNALKTYYNELKLEEEEEKFGKVDSGQNLSGESSVYTSEYLLRFCLWMVPFAGYGIHAHVYYVRTFTRYSLKIL